MENVCTDECAPPVGVHVAGAYDMALFWQCPTCNRRWHRYGEGTVMRRRAEPFVTRTLDALRTQRAS